MEVCGCATVDKDGGASKCDQVFYDPDALHRHRKGVHQGIWDYICPFSDCPTLKKACRPMCSNRREVAIGHEREVHGLKHKPGETPMSATYFEEQWQKGPEGNHHAATHPPDTYTTSSVHTSPYS